MMTKKEQGPHSAIAVHYESIEELPRILASGKGELAKQIIELAKKHNIPVVQNLSLSELLTKLDVGATISPESFSLMAEVLCFLYLADQKWQAEHGDLGQFFD